MHIDDQPLLKDLHIILYEIENAIVKREVIEIEYQSSRKETTYRAVEPIGIVVYNKAHHMIAWCHLRQGYRDFKSKTLPS